MDLPTTFTKSRVKHILADLDVVTEAIVDGIFERLLDRFKLLMRSDILKTGEVTFEEAL